MPPTDRTSAGPQVKIKTLINEIRGLKCSQVRGIIVSPRSVLVKWKKSVKFLNYNINGLLQKIDNSHLIQYITFHDFVCLTESFIATSFESDLFNDYCIYTAIAKKLSHQGRYSGVVVVMVRKQYSPYVKQISTDLQNMIVLK